MENMLITEEEYKGYTFKIYYDEIGENPRDWDTEMRRERLNGNEFRQFDYCLV